MNITSRVIITRPCGPPSVCVCLSVSGRTLGTKSHSTPVRTRASNTTNDADAPSALSRSRSRSRSLKDAVLASTSGLDRGLDAAGVDVARDVSRAVEALCAASPAPRLDLDEGALGGVWTLQYSSEFVPGNTKFAGNWPFLANNDVVRRATKPLLPRIVDVRQEIDVSGKRLDNVVTLALRPPVLDGVPVLAAQLERLGEAPVVVARLEHAYRVEGAATVTIRYDSTTLNAQGGVNGWFGGLPELSLGGNDKGDGNAVVDEVLDEVKKVLEAYNSSSFDVVYLDETLRVTRADRGELRVFVRTTTSQ